MSKGSLGLQHPDRHHPINVKVNSTLDNDGNTFKGRTLKSSKVESHGISQTDIDGSWRERANNKPLTINRNASIDSSFCL